MPSKGKFVVIEGSDGSGKSTHLELLVKWLREAGHIVNVVNFPQYAKPSAYFVEQYLNGQFGTLDSIDAYKASLFYALDRYAASFQIEESLGRGEIVVTSRYVGSNMAHQGGKVSEAQARHEYLKWEKHLEYTILGIPKPDLSIVLSMPPHAATKLIDQRGDKDKAYIKLGKRDIHELDENHLVNAYTTFNELCQLYPEQFHRVNCADKTSIRTIDSIQAEIRQLVTKLLT